MMFSTIRLIAAVVSALDSVESHIEDTLKVGYGLCHRDAVETIVREGPDRIAFLMDLGVPFERRTKTEFDLGREGGHSRRRILHAKDRTGAEIEQAVIAALYRSLQKKLAFSTEVLLQEIRATVPLAVTRKEDIEKIRQSAKGRFVPVR